jgi:hypothetical protein
MSTDGWLMNVVLRDTDGMRSKTGANNLSLLNVSLACSAQNQPANCSILLRACERNCFEELLHIMPVLIILSEELTYVAFSGKLFQSPHFVRSVCSEWLTFVDTF